MKPLLAQIDQRRLRDIQQRYAASTLNYAKYADIERWLKRHIARVQDLQLHRSPPKVILDLGCGGGFFLFVARQYSHSVMGLDIDEFPLLRELTVLFSVPRTVWTIQPFQPLPDFEQKFDWITAFSTRFNRDREDRNVWGVKEWGFFLDDLSRHLRPGGKVFSRSTPEKRSHTIRPRSASFSEAAGIPRARQRFFRGRDPVAASLSEAKGIGT